MSSKMNNKPRLMISLTTDAWVRNFIHSGACDELVKNYEVALLVSVDIKDPLTQWKTYVVKELNEANRSKWRWFTYNISMKRYAFRSSTFPVKYQETFYKFLTPFRKVVLKVLTKPGIAELVTLGVEKYLGTLKGIDGAIRSFDPDLVVIPSAFNDMFSIDALKSAKLMGKKTLLIMLNWDNISSKGVIPFLPDYMSVWGNQTFRHAVKVQGMPAEKIVILGSPQFEIYKKPLALQREDFRKSQGLPLEKKIILYAGMSRYADEISQLKFLDQAIESGVLKDVHVLYRPHPWRDKRPDEPNFFDMSFKHISMDKQLEEHYRALKASEKVAGGRDKSFFPNYQYYPILFNAVDAVITPGTTLSVESLIAGKPMIIKAFADDNPACWAEVVVKQYAHHDAWDRIPSAIISEDKDRYLDDIKQLLAMTQNPVIAEQLKKEIMEIVYDDDEPYRLRLNRVVKKVLDGEI